MVHVAAMYERPDEAATHEPWVDDFAAALRESESGAYVGFLRDEGAERVRAPYPGITWEKLVEVKSRYDPTNLFSLNQTSRQGGHESPRGGRRAPRRRARTDHPTSSRGTA